MRRVGQIKFQSNDRMDIFYTAEIWDDSIAETDESFMNIGAGDVGEDPTWVNGKPPKMKTVDVDGDTVSIQVLLIGEFAISDQVLTVYLEYEMPEELLDNEVEKPAGETTVPIT